MIYQTISDNKHNSNNNSNNNNNNNNNNINNNKAEQLFKNSELS